MAKAPRRSGGRDDKPRRPKAVRPVKPAAAKPVKPPAAKPIKPPAAAPVAKPVQPVKPAAAKPVKPPAAAPVAKPVAPVAKPATAKPVAKPMGKPAAAAPVAKPAKGGAPARKGPSRRMAEQEVGRGRAGARGAASRGGMGIGAKVGLIAALVTFLVVALTVFAAGAGGGEDEGANFNAYGYTAVSILTAPDARWYRGSGGGDKGLGYLEKKFKALLGEKGEAFWDERLKELTQPIPHEDEGTFRAEEIKKAKKSFEREVSKLGSGSSGPTGPKHVRARLSQIWNAMSSGDRDRYAIQAAWLRADDAKGTWLADSNISQSSVQTAGVDWTERGAGYAWIDGKVEGVECRIYRGPVRALKASDRMTAYVSVVDRGTKSGGGTAIGMAMLLLGPLLVGGAAFGLANAHTKNVRGLAKEIDRLGSHGDPHRSLHAHGAEATAVARSVERMVSNLEFRDKHEGADLDEVVSKEQKVAEEIHGALISKNPPRLQNYEVETLFKPGFEIGGDHFEYFRVDEDHLGLMLLDTNVRGIPAALVMSATRSYVRAAAPGVLSPAEVLKRVNRHLAGELPAGRHVTALYVVLNQADGSATIASAGHLPLLVYRHQAGKMAKVNPEGIAMGLDAGPVFDSSLQEGDIPMGLGDRIVMYTDGALRIQNAEGEEFGEQRFYGVVTSEAPKNSQAFVNFVGGAIDQFHLEVQQNDDITISTIKRLR